MAATAIETDRPVVVTNLDAVQICQVYELLAQPITPLRTDLTTYMSYRADLAAQETTANAFGSSNNLFASIDRISRDGLVLRVQEAWLYGGDTGVGWISSHAGSY